MFPSFQSVQLLNKQTVMVECICLDMNSCKRSLAKDLLDTQFKLLQRHIALQDTIAAVPSKKAVSANRKYGRFFH